MNKKKGSIKKRRGPYKCPHEQCSCAYEQLDELLTHLGKYPVHRHDLTTEDLTQAMREEVKAREESKRVMQQGYNNSAPRFQGGLRDSDRGESRIEGKELMSNRKRGREEDDDDADYESPRRKKVLVRRW